MTEYAALATLAIICGIAFLVIFLGMYRSKKLRNACAREMNSQAELPPDKGTD